MASDADDDDREVWLPIAGAPDYAVSDWGRVRLGATILRQWFDGYWKVELTFPGKAPQPYQVHRLMLAAHVGPFPPGTETNHKNGRTADNALDNLEFMTHSENVEHAWALRRRATHAELDAQMGNLFSEDA